MQKKITNQKIMKQFKSEYQQIKITRTVIKDYAFILAGVLIQAFAMRLFLIPTKLVSGGISGLAQLINQISNFPIGLMIPDRKYSVILSGLALSGRTQVCIADCCCYCPFFIFYRFSGAIYSSRRVTKDLLLNTIYGGLMYGIGLGVVYKGKGTSGGSDILGSS